MRISREVAAVCLLGLAFLAVRPDTARATSMLPQNLADLVTHASEIVVGDVLDITDGFDDRGFPYTEVTVRVDDTILGSTGSTHTFRQFGLHEPRQMPDGTTYVGVSPDGWPRFRDGERVMLFLHEGSPTSAMRTTVGLFQGKFTIADGKIVNEAGNANVFHELGLDPSGLEPAQAELMREPRSMDADSFIELVRTAVSERWVEQGRMRHAHQH